MKPQKHKDDRRTWPTQMELLAWYLHDKLSAPHPLPTDIKQMLEEFAAVQPTTHHKDMYEAYLDFQKQFLPPMEYK